MNAPTPAAHAALGTKLSRETRPVNPPEALLQALTRDYQKAPGSPPRRPAGPPPPGTGTGEAAINTPGR